MAQDHKHHNAHLRPPHLGLLALEFRAPWEFGAVIPSWGALHRAPCGDGHGVIVFPGLSASDSSTMPLRHYLRGRGYDVHGWHQGINFGPRGGVLEARRQQVLEIYETSGGKVSLIGWSLGGIYAREMAKILPEQVRSVITLGTPFAGPPTATNAYRIYDLTNGRSSTHEKIVSQLHQAPPVPTTSIFSRTDGVVAWRASFQDPSADNAQTENIEVLASHIGLGLNPSAWLAIADRLAQPLGQWQPFNRANLRGFKALLYPNPARI